MLADLEGKLAHAPILGTDELTLGDDALLNLREQRLAGVVVDGRIKEGDEVVGRSFCSHATA